jgi:hypothetical protein
MTNVETPRHDEDQQALKIATYLWDEYRYRHDLVWQLVFRVTAVATALLIAPFLASASLRAVLRGWLLFLPGLAILVILIGYYVLACELGLLKKIREAYREGQNRALEPLEPAWDPHKILHVEQGSVEVPLWRKLIGFPVDHFEERVSLFMGLILVAAVSYFVLFATVWLHKIA